MSEVERLFIGGPLNGTRQPVEDDQWSYQARNLRTVWRYESDPPFTDPFAEAPYDVVVYSLVRPPGAMEPVFVAPDGYDSPAWRAFDTEAWIRAMIPNGWSSWEHLGPWRWRGRPTQDESTYTRGGRIYVLLDERAEGRVSQVVDDWLADEPDFADNVFWQMQHVIDHHRLPLCVVPDCEEKALAVVKAAEDGRLAGRRWRKGDEIRLCPPHCYDVLRSVGVYDVDQLAEWLRPDVRLDDDPWSLEAALYWGADSQLRALRVSIPMKEAP